MEKRNIERIINKGKWADKKIAQLEKDIKSKTMLELRKSFNRIKKQVIKEWYEDYWPSRYIRKYDLYKVPHIFVNKTTGEYEYVFSSEYMTMWHRADHDYIYENSFIGGWHGGAAKLGPNPKSGYEEPHPDPGIPYWRTPAEPEEGELIYEHWAVDPAEQSKSPRDEILRLFEIEMKDIEEKMNKLFNEEEKKILDELYDFVRSHM